VGSGRGLRPLLSDLFDLATTTPQVPRVLVPVKRSALQVEAADVAGYGTLLAKVDRIVGTDDHVLAVRVLQNAPISELERSAVEEVAVGMVDAISEMGVPCTRDDLVMEGPIVVLRPLCVWR
jgi:hypothetical protein